MYYIPYEVLLGHEWQLFPKLFPSYLDQHTYPMQKSDLQEKGKFINTWGNI